MRWFLALRSRRAGWLACGLSVMHVFACAADSLESAQPEMPHLEAAVTPVASDFVELLSVDWELPAGTEQYLCTRKTLREPYYAKLVQAISPPGTHHVALSISDRPDAVDGTRPCDVAELFPRGIGGGATGTKGRMLPDGVAIELGAGSQLLINTHLFNGTERPLRGHSGIEIVPVPQAAVRVFADSLVAGPTKIDVPPGRSTTVGGCTIARDATFYGIMPHMHQTGVAMKVVARSPGVADAVLYDGPFDFENQIIHPLDVKLKAGDYIELACTYENARGYALHWGESSNDEMCQVGLGRFPAGGPSVCNR